MAKIDEILSSLQNVEKACEGYKAVCPAHDDKEASLSISEGNDGRVLLHCHAGCETEVIVDFLGLKMSDLFPTKQNSPGSISFITTTYDYHDEQSKLLYQVCRTSLKGFFQRRPDGKGGYINGLGKVKRVLYRLPELTEAVKNGNTIFIPEGEKDVDNLIKRGLSATCNPMGAGKWKKEYADYLKKADVVILPDNDDAGIKHSQEIARSIQKKVHSVKILPLPGLPEKGDVSDWFEAGNPIEKLLQLAEEQSLWHPGEEKENKTIKGEKPTDYTSFAIEGNRIYEQIYKEGVSKFIQFDPDTEKIMKVDKIETDNKIILPISGDDITFGAVKLPSGICKYNDTLDLLEEIKDHIHKYVDLNAAYLEFAAYYILLSWLYDRFHTVPYLRAIGDTGCGKSRFLDVIGGLTYKSISASGCVTPAPIYRMLKKWQGSLVLDEADLKGSDEYNEVVTILNSGFEKGRPVIRSNKNNPENVQILPVYGPKIFATRRRFQDPALEARCLTEIMKETDRDDIIPVLNDTFFNEQEKLRNKLLLFRLRNYLTINPEPPSIDLGELEPRLKQISISILALFAEDEKILKSYLNFIKGHQAELIEQRSGTTEGKIVEKLFELVSRVPSVPLDTVESATETVNYFNISASDVAEEIGIDISAQKVGTVLKNLGLKTKQTKVEGKTKRCIIEDEKQLLNLQKRYIPKEKQFYKVIEPINSTDNAEVSLPEKKEEIVEDFCPSNQWDARDTRDTRTPVKEDSEDADHSNLFSQETDDDEPWIDVEDLLNGC